MEEYRFWFRIWALVAAVFIAGIGSCTYGSHMTKEKWSKAVADGADPLVVSCALGVGGSGSAHADAIMCNTVAQPRAK
jgi:hypothetical protein